MELEKVPVKDRRRRRRRRRRGLWGLVVVPCGNI